MKPVKAVLIDMGGVLLRFGSSQGLPSGKADFRGRQALLEHLKGRRRIRVERLETLLFEPWRREYEQRYLRGREAAWDPHLTRLRKAVTSRQHTLTLLRAWFGPYADQVRPFDGAEEALSTLTARGLKLGLVSNVPLPGKLYEEVLERHRLATHFDTLQFSYDAGHRKPSPYMLRAALRRLRVPPDQAVMVGDRKNIDVVAGRAAGTRTIWVQSEYRDGPVADGRIRSIAALPTALERF